mmetsp:Transcript_9191/g.24730  ORF Transcript_9191/g.24730 Transcript_9191/m.24730 type:complete len:223 (+) Transcript_9191:130-798(+)
MERSRQALHRMATEQDFARVAGRQSPGPKRCQQSDLLAGHSCHIVLHLVTRQDVCRKRMLTDHVHPPGRRVQDCSMQLQAILRGFSDDWGEGQKLLDGVECVQLCGHLLHAQLAPCNGLSGGLSAHIAHCLHATRHDLIENVAHGFRGHLCTTELLQGGIHDFVPRMADDHQDLRRKARDSELQGGEHCTAGMSCDVAHALLNEHLPRLAVEDILVRDPQIR